MEDPDHGEAVSQFFSDADGSGLLRFSFRHPRRAVQTLTAVYRLPVVDASPSDSTDGRAVEAGLRRRSRLGRALVRGATGVIRVPSTVAEFERGASRRSMRKQANGAVRAGVQCIRVDDPDRRQALLIHANAFEQAHPREEYRTDSPDNRDLLDLGSWFAACSAAGEPLVLAVIAVDGEWALLKYLRVVSADPDASAARYLLVRQVVEELTRRRVRFLTTNMSPVRLAPGLRVFQDRLGFTLVRVRLRPVRRQEPTT